WLRHAADAWREGHLSLTGLSRRDRLLAVATLLAIAVACLVVVTATLGIPLPGGTIAVPGDMVASRTPVDFSPLRLVLACLGMAAAAAAIAVSATAPGRTSLRWLLVLELTLIGLAGLVLQ